ncbi:MAG: TetR/AcrR family transcriptional regulator [Corynebacterium sp.]|uniref:TetR/AcrR family transcriptional regulator n=1 Tax=unclassified Corynebacterium TaxID=2624378 RepID=UPI003F9048A7
MPTPGKRDPAGRRAAILDAAAELICEAGASCLTHRAVAARAHVAVGSTTQYFASIDDLRDEALQALADENDEALAEVAGILETLDGSGAVEETIARCAGILHDFLADPRQVHASLAMTSTAMTDPSLRTLALQWSDQLTDLLAGRFGRPRAAAAVAYVDGLTVHAALHDGATDTSSITAVLTALLAMPDTQEPTP